MKGDTYKCNSTGYFRLLGLYILWVQTTLLETGITRTNLQEAITTLTELEPKRRPNCQAMSGQWANVTPLHISLRSHVI